MNTEDIRRMHREYVMSTYAPGLALVRGEGVRVYDAEDHEYLDFLAGIAVTNLGHAHPRYVEAIREQAGRLVHVSNLYYNEHQPRLARDLVERSGFEVGKCFFCNSGAEANEGLIKLARLWGHDQGRYEVVSMRGSFHGRTLATLTATGQDKVQKGFAPLPQGFRYAEFNDPASCREQIGPETAAVLVEAIQGEGGVRPAHRGYLRQLRKICDEEGVLLLMDEVQCGMGRTGRWFGFQHYGVQPDAFALAKGLGNGFPMGAVVAGAKLADVFHPGHHATTFGGTPLACAAARAVIEVIETEGLIENAGRMGHMLVEGLCSIAADHPRWIEEVRGLGLMVGLVLDRPAAPLQKKLQEKGLLALATAGKVLRFLPPLIVGEDDVRRALEITAAACDELEQEGTEASR
ncbi:Acetylornithine aminotransferase [Kiritimatiella glycovorans]|uniref:Acetylornithine aminotransferase n=2 Tax=Kiritimatiella glycovorans TaxID=1307763 RepID=A0A0G3EHP7_9BACT|nr:Acetylornithine aminotransferase [Kiritimatiella glycovorans]